MEEVSDIYYEIDFSFFNNNNEEENKNKDEMEEYEDKKFWEMLGY